MQILNEQELERLNEILKTNANMAIITFEEESRVLLLKVEQAIKVTDTQFKQILYGTSKD